MSVVIVSLQRSVHGNISFMYETCSVSCHRPVTTYRARLFIPKECNMLCQLSSSHYNGQSMVIYLFGINHLHQLSSSHDNSQSMVKYPSSMKHAPSIVIVSGQWSEHGYISFMYDICCDV